MSTQPGAASEPRRIRICIGYRPGYANESCGGPRVGTRGAVKRRNPRRGSAGESRLALGVVGIGTARQKEIRLANALRVCVSDRKERHRGEGRRSASGQALSVCDGVCKTARCSRDATAGDGQARARQDASAAVAWMPISTDARCRGQFLLDFCAPSSTIDCATDLRDVSEIWEDDVDEWKRDRRSHQVGYTSFSASHGVATVNVEPALLRPRITENSGIQVRSLRPSIC